MSAHELTYEPTFVRDGKTIYLRCVNDHGVHMGDLKIAEALMETHADTLTNAANAGIEMFKQRTVEEGLRKILGDQP